MDVTFDRLTVGGRGRLDFEVKKAEPSLVQMEILSSGVPVGTLDIDLTLNTGAVIFTAPMVKTQVTLTGQVFEPGDIVRDLSGATYIVFSQAGDSVYIDPAAAGSHPSDQFWKIGFVDLSSLDLSEV